MIWEEILAYLRPRLPQPPSQKPRRSFAASVQSLSLPPWVTTDTSLTTSVSFCRQTVARHKIFESTLPTGNSAAANATRRFSRCLRERDIRNGICFPNTDGASLVGVGKNRGGKAAVKMMCCLPVSRAGKCSDIAVVFVSTSRVMESLRIHGRYGLLPSGGVLHAVILCIYNTDVFFEDVLCTKIQIVKLSVHQYLLTTSVVIGAP